MGQPGDMPATATSSLPDSPKRDHLMATAWRLFYQEGYRSVGIDTLLAEARVAKMTLYHHFSSKDELIVALLDQHHRAILESMERFIASAGPKPARRLLAVFDWLAEWFVRDDFRGCAFIRALSEFPEPTHPVHQAAWRFKEAFNARLADLAREAGARRPTALADALSLLIDGAIIAAHATGRTAPATTARTTASSLLKAATARNAAASENNG